jgi:CubicO group peptidase (beta-lactamase class C family)
MGRGPRIARGDVMRKTTLRIGMSTLATLIGVSLPLAFWIGYYVYSLYAWFHVGPVELAPEASDAERLAAVDYWLDEQFENHKFNGGVLFVRRGEVLLSKTCGFTDHTAKQRLDDHSAFQLASVSKQFTAAGVLRLAEIGSLTLDDPVAMHLDGFISDKVTIRHLLNQTSGIPDVYMDLAEEHRKELGESLTTSDVIGLVKQYAELKHQPGDEMEYSNTNYVLLAGIVETVSGMSFERFMHEELFEPLGMHDTRVWNLLSTERSPNQASDFDQVDEDRSPVETPWIDGVAGDGAVYCSLHDFVIWDQFWEGNPLISNELLRQATTRPKLNDGTTSDYGFGWVIERKGHWHNGAWLGANTFIARYPQSRCCLVVLDNSSNPRVDEIAGRLVEALLPILAEDE